MAQIFENWYSKTMRFIYIFAWAFCLFIFSTNAFAGNGNIAVIELYTSQGCNDAPPAEETFHTLSQTPHQNLIMLSCHITLFDEDGWKDTLSNPLCDERQEGYEDVLSVFDSSSIPQIIVNGRFSNKGQKESLIRSSIEMAHSLDEIVPVQLSLSDETLGITLPKIRVEQGVDVWLFAYDKSETVSIKSGPNEGQKLTHTNAVQHMQKLFLWDGAYTNLNIPLTDLPAEGYAIIAQYKDYSKIVAAGKIQK